MKHQLSWNAEEFPQVTKLYQQTKQRKIRGKFTRMALLLIETSLAERRSASPANAPAEEQSAPQVAVSMDDELAAALDVFK